jgi:hypothetical protein
MKNIHVLPTDKPSKLVLRNADNKLVRHTPITKWHSVNQHIYITNDEEIKDVGYCLHKDGKGVICKVNLIFENGDLLLNNSTRISPLEFRKIILTTDQDLIVDGVQAIDDEFLEWFVNNTSCDRVEIKTIIVPFIGIGYKIIIPKEEPKQETLEEAAANLADPNLCKTDNWIAGAKWQAERSYSEEEVEMIARDAYEMGRKNILIGVFNKWFEQFKKK